MSVFHVRLKEIMDAKGVKAADIARGTKISTSAISKYLSNGDKTPIAKNVMLIAKYLDISSEWLYGATDTKKPFYDPSIIDTYEKLSTKGKQEVYNFALFLLQKENGLHDKESR